MTRPNQPTSEGMHRYPDHGGFMVELKEPVPCTCEETCRALCTGECGCEACAILFTMFCEETGYFPETRRELEHAIIRYRGEL
jgi:hypothetical protein